MKHEDSLYPGDWLRIAEKDLKRVEHLLASMTPSSWIFPPAGSGEILQSLSPLQGLGA